MRRRDLPDARLRRNLLGLGESETNLICEFQRREILRALATMAALGATARDGFGASAAAPTPPALRKGFNLPDQAPQRAGRAAKAEILRRLRARGMTHVRLPIQAESFLPEFSGPATRGAALDDLERALGLLLETGFSVSVDMHPGRQFNDLHRADPPRTHAVLREGWCGVAARLARWPASRVFAELLNEPAVGDDLWRPEAERLAEELRALLPETTLIVGPAPFQRIEALEQWRPFADRNMVHAVHYYDPMIFTHQGLTWDKASPYAHLGGVPFPLARDDPALTRLTEAAAEKGDEAQAAVLRKAALQAWTPDTIKSQFASLAAWSARHSAPVIVNEFGALRFKAARADRLVWLAATRAAIEAQGFGWAHWDYDGAFGLLDESGAIDEGVIEALTPT